MFSQNLYPIIAFFLRAMGSSLNPDDSYPYLSQFSIFYCGIILSVLLFPLSIMKAVNFLMKINSYGIYFVSILLLFVMGNGIYSMTNTTFDFEYIKNNDGSTTRHLYLFGENPAILAGSLSLGYFSHSFVLSMMKNNEKQENNKRDLFIGYFLVFMTYVTVGIVGYIGFSGSSYTAEYTDVIINYL